MRICCLITDGFEDIEALGTVAILRRSGISVDLVSVFDHETVKGSFLTEVVVNKGMKDVYQVDYDGIFIPGGRQAYMLRETGKVLALVKEFYEANKWLMAICAGPTIFGVLGILDGVHYTSFPGTETYMKKGIKEAKAAVTDGHIITGAGAGVVTEFALEIIKNLLGIEAMQEIKNKILFEAFKTGE